MKGGIYKELKKWEKKSDDIRKPLILEGACQNRLPSGSLYRTDVKKVGV